MKRYCLSFLSITLGMLMACSSKNPNAYYVDENAVRYDHKAKLQYVDDIAFEADKSTTSAMSGTGYFTDKKTGKAYVTFLSPATKSIMIYDVDTKKCIRKISVSDDGPNNTGPMTTPAMHKLLSLDSVLYFNFDNLYLLNSEGSILKKFSVVDPKGKADQPKPNPGTYAPIFVNGSYAYLICSYNAEFKQQSGLLDLIKINLETGEKSEHFNRSTVYDNGFWGYNLNLYFLYGTFNPKTNEIVLGYAAEPFVHSYSLKNDTQQRRKFVGSEHFKAVNPFLDDRNDFKRNIDPQTMAKSAEHEISNPSYYALFFDEGSQTYIRVAFMPKSKAEYHDPVKRNKFKCTFILFDRDFNKIGEDILPDASVLDFRMMYIADGSLHIFNKQKYNKDNDQLYFDRYKLLFN